MNSDKDTIQILLRINREDTQGERAQQELPGQVDINEHAGPVEKLRLNPTDVTAKLSGGRSGGGINQLSCKTP